MFISGIKNKNLPRANEKIVSKEVRLIDNDGTMLGICSIFDALAKANKAGLDLVEISPHASPPVCKVLDFGKFKYEAKKRLNDAKKKQKVIVVKEMKFKINIGSGDFDTKIRKIKEFLAGQDKVKISLWFKGREIVYNEIGKRLFNKIIAELDDIMKIDSGPKLEGKQMIMLISPI